MTRIEVNVLYFRHHQKMRLKIREMMRDVANGK